MASSLATGSLATGSLATGSQGMATRHRRQVTEHMGSILRPHPRGSPDIRPGSKLTLPRHRRNSKPIRRVLRQGTKDIPLGRPPGTRLQQQQQGRQPSRRNG